jgi:hypothetical protein
VSNERFLLQVRIAPDLVKAVDRMGVEWGVTRAATVERLLRQALNTHSTPSGWPFRVPGQDREAAASDQPSPPPPPTPGGE